MRLRSLVAPLASAAILGVACLVPAIASADPVNDAKDLFTRGRELRARGDCTTALPLFRKAYELYPAGLGSLRNTAECEESLGHFASARRSWLDLKRALLTERDPKYDGWSNDAEEAAARLAPKLAVLTVEVRPVGPQGEAEAGDGVEVRLNGEILPPSLIGTALERDPGRYVVSVSGPRVAAPQERVVQLAAGGSQKVSLRVAVSGPAVAASPSAPPVSTPGSAAAPEATPPSAPSSNAAEGTSVDETRRTGAWVAFGVAGAGLIGTVASAIVYENALGTLKGNNGCTNVNGTYMCTPNTKDSVQSTHSTGATAATLFNVFLPVTLVAAGTGVVLLATAHKRNGQAALVLNPGGASLVGSF